MLPSVHLAGVLYKSAESSTNPYTSLSLSSPTPQDLSKFLNELGSCKVVNEKTVRISNLHNLILDRQTDINEVHKLFQEGLNECSGEKESSRKLISALIERCISDSIEEQGT